MRSSRLHTRTAAFATALLLVLQIAPALGDTQDAASQQGSRVPGMPLPSVEKPGSKNRSPIEVTFTKWPVPGSTTPYPLLGGFTGGDAPGTYVGEVLHRVLTQPRENHNRVFWLEAMYEVQAGDRSFTALIRGGQNADGLGLLDGVIVAGWHTGAQVHVEFQRYFAPSENESGCRGAPKGLTCFVGVIHIERGGRD
jgi:hypothetical protein